MRAAQLFLITLLSSLSTLGGCSLLPGDKPMEGLFGIYVTNLSGEGVRRVITHPSQQMTHPRVSPDGEWITFTRYTKTNAGGVAMEDELYEGTEVMLVRLDGTGLQTLVPAKKGLLNCNSSWADGGKSVIWVTTDNPQKQPQLMKMDIATRRITRIPTPPELKTTDPNIVGDQIVFPVVGKGMDSIWIMNTDGTNARRLTSPKYEKKMLPNGKFPPGDYDPKLSPDGKKVAVMRLFGEDGWRIFVVDVATGEEVDLSGPDNIDAIPDWSSDGRILIFWHVDKKDLSKMGVYTMRPDGRERTMVPLPRQFLHGHPHFFPASGSSPTAKIIYHATLAPKLP